MRIVAAMSTALILALPGMAAHADGGGDHALRFVSIDNEALMEFREGSRGAQVIFEESIRDDHFHQLWLRVAMWNTDEAIGCGGVVDQSGVTDYGFRHNAVYVEAVLPFYCAGGPEPFDVEVSFSWTTDGPAQVEASTTVFVDTVDDTRIVWTSRQVLADSVDIVPFASWHPFGNDIPAVSDAYFHLRHFQTLIPQPGDDYPI